MTASERMNELLEEESIMNENSGSDTTETLNNTREIIERQIEVGDILDEYFKLTFGHNMPKIISGWDIENNSGEISCRAIDALVIEDKETGKSIKLKKRLMEQRNGLITWEFRFKMPVIIEGTSFILSDKEKNTIELAVCESYLCVLNSKGEKKPIIKIEPYSEYGIKVIIDLTSRKTNISVNGILFIKDHSIDNENTINSIAIETGKQGIGVLEISPIRIYKGYEINEKFITASEGVLPYDYKVTKSNENSKAFVAPLHCTCKPDIYSFRMENAPGDNLTAAKNFNMIDSDQIIEFKYYQKSVINNSRIILYNNAKAVAGIVMKDKKIFALSSADLIFVKEFNENLWNEVRIEIHKDTHLYTLFINGRKRVENIPMTENLLPNSLSFETGNTSCGEMWFDDLFAYKKTPLPSDYVPKPIPVHGNYLVGMQSFNGFREGSHYGYDCIKNLPDRIPTMGYYTEGLPEVADWETKWLLEHGVNFQFPCWFRPHAELDQPIKDPEWVCSALHRGYFYSEYSDMIKYSIMWESQHQESGCSGFSDFIENVLPFWIEYYFKDPRYFLIDNKPLIGIYQMSYLERDFGGIDGAKKVLEIIRNACIDAGFDGACIIVENRNSSKEELEQIKEAGFDYVYAYTWYIPDKEGQVDKMLTQKEFNVIDPIASISVGWCPSPWGGGDAGFATVEDFESLAKWARDDYMTKFDVNSLASRLVMVDNWNEWGEGHFVMPSSLGGFGYVDALRNVFTDAPDHTDDIPTDKQKARLDILYPRAWE